MNNLQVLIRLTCVATVLLSNGISVNAFLRLHPNFPDHDTSIFNGDDDRLSKETVVRAEKWSKYHGSKFDRFHGMRTIEWCRPLSMRANRMEECQDRGRFPVQNECRGFLMCMREGDTPVPSCCPYGLYFDHIQRTCVKKEDAQCFNVCPEIGVKFTDPKDPRKYFECSNLGIPESVSCPQNTPDKDSIPERDIFIFDSESQECKSHETINAEVDNSMGKKFDDAFQKTFGVPSFQAFDEDDFSQKAPIQSSTLEPTTTTLPISSSTSMPTQTEPTLTPSLPGLSPLVGYGPQPAKYEQLLDMAGDDSSDSDSTENTDNENDTNDNDTNDNPAQSTD